MNSSPSKPITIIGCGPADANYLIPIAAEHINNADVLIGSRRLLELYNKTNRRCVQITADMNFLLTKIDTLLSENVKIVVLVTGDTGVASVASPIVSRFGNEKCQCIPGISSIQLACARLCIDWTNALIINAHKETPAHPINFVQQYATVIMLCGNRQSWHQVLLYIKSLEATHNGHRCSDLGSDNEIITPSDYKNCLQLPDGGGNSILIWQRKGN